MKRKRNLPFDALVESCPGTDPNVDAGQVAAALKTIRRRLVTESEAPGNRGENARALVALDESDPQGNLALSVEIRHRARLYRSRWPDVEITPSALAKHWTRLIVEQPRATTMSPSDIATMFDES